jgi:micrococcal nuclease
LCPEFLAIMACDMSAIRWAATTFAVAAICATGVAAAVERLAGPYPAEVERVVDGDTLAVRVAVWLQQDLSVLVRIRGIDAPELHGRCEDEKAQAREAAVALERLVAGGEVALTVIEGDKYFGRVIADVATSAGENVGAALVAGGYARTYDGGKRGSWCGGGEIGRVETPNDLAALSEAPR